MEVGCVCKETHDAGKEEWSGRGRGRGREGIGRKEMGGWI